MGVGDDTQLQPSNKNSPEQYMDCYNRHLWPNSHFPRSLCTLAFQTRGPSLPPPSFVLSPSDRLLLSPFPSLSLSLSLHSLSLSLSHSLTLSFSFPLSFGLNVHHAHPSRRTTPCDGTRPLLIINISRTRSAGKSPARPILCGL